MLTAHSRSKRNAKQKCAKFIPKIVRRPFQFCLIISTIIFTIVTFFFFVAQSEIPLFYSLADAKQQLANKAWIWLIAGISFLLNLFHFFLIKAFYNLDKLVIKLFAWSTLVLQIVLGLTIIRIFLVI